MDISNKRYLLILEGKERTGKTFTGFSKDFSYDSLKDAFKALEEWGNHRFDETIVAQQNGKMLIEDAIIKDKLDNKVILSKFQLRENDIENVPGAVYMRINHNKISPEEFELQTGISLKNYRIFWRNVEYYQVCTTDKLKSEMPLRDPGRRPVKSKRHRMIKARWRF